MTQRIPVKLGLFKSSNLKPVNPSRRHQTMSHSTTWISETIENDQIAPNDFSTTSLDFLHWGDLFTWDVSVLDNPPQLPYDNFDTLPMNLNWPNETNMGFSESLDMMPFETASDDVAWPQLDLMMDAPLLLKHFNDDVISQMGSLPINEKSAWKTLHYPSAIMTLSELTMLDVDRDQIKRANLATFYALIAVSSFHLSLNSITFPSLARPGDHWKSLSSRTYEAAKQHLKVSLEKESQPGPHKAKYKEQLMGISAVLATALLSGNETDTRWCLTEMERLISWRGLTKPSISRRARLLHNIYAWMRIVSESLNVYLDENHAIETPFRTTTSRSINPDMTLDNFLHLEPRKLHGQKTKRDIKDIHLADASQDHENMYMQIYGVPETWLSLVSQITRLANVMDRLSASKKSDAEALMALQPRASYLENAVCLFRSRHNESTTMSASPSAPGGTPHMHMVRALASALVIFFYRRIRNVNPLVLQDSVNDVVESLHAFDEALERNNLLGPGTAWPAFIAGAEARARQRRDIEEWLDKGFGRSGFESYRASKEVLVEVWRRRDEAEGIPSGDVCTYASCVKYILIETIVHRAQCWSYRSSWSTRAGHGHQEAVAKRPTASRLNQQLIG
ncbi:Arginine metabolism regulation protein II [Fusarium oxysporum f. sp. cubense race 1]|uniref:Arginine metabolism regulation protein II n=1 Tax=Fusarium oxysporum f. sp. cubense (strain race 1) TaxID=1229664 RepID=N4V3D9_FUSC1|nr:Arginine metabolism regulation protein II [Fusarium oxysporum f. sp. cubense race 1]